MPENQVKIQLTAEDKASAVVKRAAQAHQEYLKSYESLSDYMKRSASEAQKAAASNNQLSSSMDRVADSLDDAADSGDQASGRFDGLFGTFTKANLAASAIEKGIQLAMSAIKNAGSDASNYERSLLGLESAAAAFGISTESVNAAVKTLTNDGLLGFSTTASALKTLLSTGMDLDTATMLMERFKDEASFGRAESIDFATAVGNLAQAYKTNSSELGDLSGHTGNFSDAIEVGAAALGKQVSQLTAAETEQAKLIGYMQDGAHTAGNAAAFSDTYAGSLARQAAEAERASVSLGTAMLPAMEYVTQGFGNFIAGVNESATATQTFQAYLVTFAAVVRTIANIFIGSFQAMWGAAQSLMTLSWKPLQDGLDSAAEGFENTWSEAFAQYEKIYTDSNQSRLEDLERTLKETENASAASNSKIAQQMDDANKQYRRSMEQRAKQFQESMRDMIIAHRDKARSLESDLAKEDAAYTKSRLLREQRYLDDIESLEERHAEKVADIQEQISEEKNRGLVVDGVLYQEANQQKIDKLEAQLAKELTAHRKALDERKAEYDTEMAEDKARHDERISQLQVALAEERAILEQHRLEVAAVGDAQKEDDISRLKRQFEEANAEAARNHQEQLARIQSSGTAQGSAYGTAMNEELRKKIEETKRLIEEATNAQTRASTAGSSTATHWWTSFKDTLSSWFQGFPGLVSEWINNGASSIKAKTQHQFTGPMGGVGQLFSNAIDWITKREGGGPVTAGQPYIVGEREPELFVPRQSGQILNGQQIQQVMSGSKSSGVTINGLTINNYTPNTNGSIMADLGWEISRRLA